MLPFPKRDREPIPPSADPNEFEGASGVGLGAFAGGGLIQTSGPLFINWYGGHTLLNAFGFQYVGIGYGYHDADLAAQTPTSQLTVGGAIATPYHSVAGPGNTDIDDHDDMLDLDASGGNTTVTLPDATTCKGREYTIKRIDASANTATVLTTSAQNIDQAATFALAAQDSTVTVKSNGANWRVKGKF